SREKRTLPNKRFRPIDRINEPHTRSAHGVLPRLLPIKPIGRKPPAQNPLDSLLSPNVSLRNRRRIGLRRHSQIPLIQRPNNLSPRLRRSQGRHKLFGCHNYLDRYRPTHGTFQEPRSMGNRLSKIYTRTGDDGTTGLGDGTRVPKDGPRVEAYGTVDELNSTI